MRRFDIITNFSQLASRYIPVLIFLFAIFTRFIPGLRTIDDSYITYRYARNILAGNGFVFNPGEHVLGTTTPLYTILLAGLGLLSGGTEAPFPQIAIIINAIADGITCLLLLGLGKKLGSHLAGLGAAILWAIHPFSVTYAIGGMETSVYVLFLTATMSTYISKRYTLAAFWGALAFLTRPDAIILLGPLVLARIWHYFNMRSKQSIINILLLAKGEILTLILPITIWLLFATIYFGSPIPNSIAAKSIAYRLPPFDTVIRLLRPYVTPFFGHMTFGIYWVGIGMILFPSLSLIGARRAILVKPNAWPLLAYPLLYFITFVTADPTMFGWYLVPPLPIYILTILIGVESLLYKILLQKSQSKNKNVRTQDFSIKFNFILVIVMIFVPSLLTVRGWTFKPDHGYSRPAPEMAWYELELLYRQAAKILAPEIARMTSTAGSATSLQSPLLAAGDVGVIGYFTKARILDTIGLNSPQSLHYYPLAPELYAINVAISPDLIIDQQPSYVVLLEIYGRNGLLKDTRFLQQYQLRQKIPTDIYGSKGMLIFQRAETKIDK